MKTGNLTQSELPGRLSSLVAIDLLRGSKRGSLERRLRPALPPGEAIADAPSVAVARPASAAARGVVAELRHAVDLYLLACEPFPGAASLDEAAVQGDFGGPCEGREPRP